MVGRLPGAPTGHRAQHGPRWSTVEVGSIPGTDRHGCRIGRASFTSKFDVAGPAAHSALTRVSWLGVFRTWNLTKAISSVVSSEGRALDV